MTEASTHYTFTVRGHLGQRMQRAFSGLACTPRPDGTTAISGALPDQAAVYAVLLTIQRLGLTLIAVQTQPEEPPHVE